MENKFDWGHSRRFNDFSSYIKSTYGDRVQKISINVGFSCPNRDGTKGKGGCVYCDNETFKPGYCEPLSPVQQQVEKGVGFFEKKYPTMRFMAYFQSYTNTYAPVESLKSLYVEALSHPKVTGLVIGTRPDCINEEILTMLSEINKTKPVTIEYGVESTINRTLEEINRCHTYEEAKQAILLTDKYGIKAGAHLILGLPGESKEEIIGHAEEISKLPVHTIKLHQLQIIKNTLLAKKYEDNPDYVHLFSFEEYLALIVTFIERLNPKIIIERFVSTSPLDKLIAPKWNRMKNFEVVAQIEKELNRQDTWQGKHYVSNL